MDPGARPRPRHTVEGQLHRLAGAEGRPPQARGLAGEGAPEGDQEGTRVGAQQRQGRPLHGQGAPGADRGAAVGRLPADRKSVVEGTSVSVRVDLDVRANTKTKTRKTTLKKKRAEINKKDM